MPTTPSTKPTTADIQWQSTASTKPTNLVVSGPGTYISMMRRIRNFPQWSLISDWMLSDPTDPTSRQVSSDIAGTLAIQVANVGDSGDKPFGNISWVPLPACTFNLQTDGYPYVSLLRTSAYNYMQVVLTVSAGSGVFFSQFSNTEA